MPLLYHTFCTAFFSNDKINKNSYDYLMLRLSKSYKIDHILDENKLDYIAL